MAKASTATATALSYLQSLQQSPADQLQEELLARVQEVKSNWEVSIAKTRASIARAKQALAQGYRTANLQEIVDQTNNVAALESGLAVAEKAFAVLFPAEA